MFAAVTGSLLIFGGGVILNYNESFAEKELPLLEVAEYLEEKECPNNRQLRILLFDAFPFPIINH